MKDYRIIILNAGEVYDVCWICADTLATACQTAIDETIADIACNVDADVLRKEIYSDCAEAAVLVSMTNTKYIFLAREFEEKDEDLL